MVDVLLGAVRANREAIIARGVERARQSVSHDRNAEADTLRRNFAAILQVLVEYWQQDEAARVRTRTEMRCQLPSNVTLSPPEVVSGLDILSTLIRSYLESNAAQPLALLPVLELLDEGVNFLRQCYVESQFALIEQRLARLHELTVAIGGELSLERALTLTVEGARELTNARYVALGVPNASGGMERLVVAGMSDAERAAIGELPRGRGLLGILLKQVESIRIKNVQQDPRFTGFPSGHPPMRSFLGVPIVSRNQTVGSLYLADKQDADEFGADDQRLVEMLAAHAAVAIETASLYERLRQRSFESQTLYKISQDVGYTLNYHELVRLLLEHLHPAVPHDVAASILATDNLCHLYIRATRPLLPAVQEDIQKHLVRKFIRISENDTSLEQEPPQIHTLEVEGFDPEQPPITRLSSFFEVPLSASQGQETVGLLFLGAEREDAFTGDQVRLLYTVANQASLSIQRLQTLVAETQQQRLESMLEHLPEGVVVVDADLRLVLANPVAKTYLRALTDQETTDILNHLGGCPIEELLLPPIEGRSHEVEANGPPYNIFEVEARSLAVGPESGGWVLVLRDVTEDRRVQERVQQQERLAAVGQLAAGVAHDFNNILTGIIGFADLLWKRPDMPESAQSRLERIVQQGERGAHLVRQILDFSRASVSQLMSLDLAPFVKETAKFLERTIPESIRIVLDIDPGEHYVNADPSRLQQVLTNLAVNAWDAMPAGGELKFRIGRFKRMLGELPPCLGMPPGEWVTLSVSDNGMGIPSDVLPHVFEPFFTTKGPGKGTGLGLAQVYGIVKQHEGYISAESQDGKGTTLCIYLPSLVVQQPLPRREEPEVIRHGQGETVLLVEDEPSVLEVGKAMLEHLGYRILTATNGHEALDMYETYRDEIALVLMDLVMPEMDGIQLLSALKELNPSIKAVMMSGYPLGEETEQLMDQGISTWLQKPLKPAQLAQAVSQALQE